MIIDTHAHLADKTLAADLPHYLDLATQAGVGAVLCIGTNLQDSKQAISIAQQHPQVRAAIGIHPNVCCQAGDGDWAAIEAMCRAPENVEHVTALGETGLDKHWDDCPWDMQVDFFRRHLALSRETELPVVIHTRECAEETLEVLKSEATRGPLRGVMHSYTGPWEVAEACVELGLFISFAGMVTFKNGIDILDVACRIPADRILVETDSPYLTPHPHRGKRPNHPALVAHTLEKIAEARGVSKQEFARQTTENAQRLFGGW
jgi:TatD DNase family protein